MARLRRKQVRDRAKNRCEYCQLHQDDTILPHEVDHIRAKKHRGPTTLQNTCWSCASCNSAKGPNAAGYDPLTEELVPLFDPGRDVWEDHFEWDGPILKGLTPVGRATIDVLNINELESVEHRRLLQE